LKLAAGGAQLLALALVSSAIIAPLFTSTVVAPIWERSIACVLAGSFEFLALTLLRFIPLSSIE
jgi:hypothetical protein